MNLPGRELIEFGFYLAGVGISVTFGSLILLYFMLRLFLRVERRYGRRAEAGAEEAEESLPAELAAAIGVAINLYLAEEREHLRPEWRLELRKPSAWRSSGRSES